MSAGAQPTFDPDAFHQQFTQAGGFDPDKFHQEFTGTPVATGQKFLADRDTSQQPGFLEHAGNVIKNQVKSIGGAFVAPYTKAVDTYNASRAGGHGVLASAGMGALSGIEAANDPLGIEQGIAEGTADTVSGGYSRRRAEGYNPVYSALAPSVAPVVGVNLPAMEHSAEIGDTPGVAAEGAVPAAEVAAGYGASKIPVGDVTDAIGSAARQPSGKLKPIVRNVSRLGGAGVGGYFGGGPGAVAGALTGPSLMDAVLPAHPNPIGLFSKIPARMPRVALEASEVASPFSTAGSSNGVGNRGIILPGQEIDPATTRSAGSAAQATASDLRTLAAHGDRSAQLELVRRRLLVGKPTGEAINYSQMPLPRGAQ